MFRDHSDFLIVEISRCFQPQFSVPWYKSLSTFNLYSKTNMFENILISRQYLSLCSVYYIT